MSSPLQPEHREAVLLSNPWFAGMPDATRRAVLDRSHGVAHPAGQRIFSRGSKPDGLYCVLEGEVQLSGTSIDGQETILDFYGPGVWFGEVSLLDGGPRIHDVDARSNVVVLHLPSTDFEDLLRTDQAFCRAVMRLAAMRLRIVLTALELYSTQTLEQRLAHRLLLLSEYHGRRTSRGVELELRLSQENMARLIGSTRQRVNQILKHWAEQGIIEHRSGHVTILGRERLEAMVRL